MIQSNNLLRWYKQIKGLYSIFMKSFKQKFKTVSLKSKFSNL